MGKYNLYTLIKEHDGTSEISTALNHIIAVKQLNELAEMNRLKRIELKITCAKYDLMGTGKELVDMA